MKGRLRENQRARRRATSNNPRHATYCSRRARVVARQRAASGAYRERDLDFPEEITGHENTDERKKSQLEDFGSEERKSHQVLLEQKYATCKHGVRASVQRLEKKRSQRHVVCPRSLPRKEERNCFRSQLGRPTFDQRGAGQEVTHHFRRQRGVAMVSWAVQGAPADDPGLVEEVEASHDQNSMSRCMPI